MASQTSVWAPLAGLRNGSRRMPRATTRLSLPNRVRTTPGWKQYESTCGHLRAASAVNRMFACLLVPYADIGR